MTPEISNASEVFQFFIKEWNTEQTHYITLEALN